MIRKKQIGPAFLNWNFHSHSKTMLYWRKVHNSLCIPGKKTKNLGPQDQVHQGCPGSRSQLVFFFHLARHLSEWLCCGSPEKLRPSLPYPLPPLVYILGKLNPDMKCSLMDNTDKFAPRAESIRMCLETFLSPHLSFLIC